MRYIIGIDLGTTNSSVAYVDTESTKNSPFSIQLFKIPQMTSTNIFDSQTTLPSFCFINATYENSQEVNRLPWGTSKDYIVGKLAQTLGAKTPTRLVQSAKSWLCNSAASRKDKILPIEAADNTQRISPVEASARYLSHIKEAWNHLMARGNADHEFEQQEIILTVPASFDEVARTLTAEAAKLAGLQKVTLLEEPQAAFYSWISQHETTYPSKLAIGDTVLVCDVGGGTTDFSLIEMQQKEDKPFFQRMSVGDHLLLGGDNIDAAIAYFLEGKLKKLGTQELTTTQWLQLLQQARNAKEHLLEDTNETSTYSVLLQGTGSHVIQGSISLEITREELLELIHSGFFPENTWEKALEMKKSAGFRNGFIWR